MRKLPTGSTDVHNQNARQGMEYRMTTEMLARTRAISSIIEGLKMGRDNPIRAFAEFHLQEIRTCCLEAMKRWVMSPAQEETAEEIAKNLLEQKDLLFANAFLEAYLYSPGWEEHCRRALQFYLAQPLDEAGENRSKAVYGRLRKCDGRKLYPFAAAFVRSELEAFHSHCISYRGYGDMAWHRFERAAKLALEFADLSTASLLVLIQQQLNAVGPEHVSTISLDTPKYMLPVLRAQHNALVDTIIKLLQEKKDR